jgi:hypothetical protein
MKIVRHAICSQRESKPVVRRVCDTLVGAENLLQDIREAEAHDPEQDYWIIELGPECETWRVFENVGEVSHGAA